MNGVQGFQGSTGAQGFNGTNGTQGFQGAQGATGIVPISAALNYVQTDLSTTTIAGTNAGTSSAANVVSLTITTNGNPVHLSFYSDVYASYASPTSFWGTIQFFRDEIAIGNNQWFEQSALNLNVPVSMTYIDNPGSSGTYKYSVRLTKVDSPTASTKNYVFGEDVSGGPVLTAFELANVVGATGAQGFQGATGAAGTGTNITDYAQSRVLIAGATSTSVVGASNMIYSDISGLIVRTASQFQQVSETIQVKSVNDATRSTHNWSLGSIFYHTGMNATFTTNITNLSPIDNRIYTITLILNQGPAPYYSNVLQLGGVGQTINWVNGTQPQPLANKKDVQTFTLIHASGTWTALGDFGSYG
jgi:hypothetical protein